MYGVSLLCLALNVWEMLHLGLGTICDILRSRRRHTPLPDRRGPLYGLTETPALNEAREGPAAAGVGESYGSYPFSWSAASAPPGYNIAVKPLLVSNGLHDPQPLRFTELSNNAKMACRQNRVNIAQEEQRRQYDDNLTTRIGGGDGREAPQKSPDGRQAQDRLEVAIQAYSQQQGNSGTRCKPQRERKPRQASKHSSGGSKADRDRASSSNSSSSRYEEGKGSEWI